MRGVRCPGEPGGPGVPAAGPCRRESGPEPGSGRERLVASRPARPRTSARRSTSRPGFEIQLVASEPDIHKPLNLAFDDRGRLWVTDTVEYPFPQAGRDAGRDTVKILSDFGPDGRAGKIQTFADGLNIPIGLLPLPVAAARRSSTTSRTST